MWTVPLPHLEKMGISCYKGQYGQKSKSGHSVGSTEGIYFKTKVKTEKVCRIWPDFRSPVLCDGRQITHCTFTMTYFFPLLQGIFWLCASGKKREKKASVQPQTSICLKKQVLQHLRGFYHMLSSHMCSVTSSTPIFSSEFHRLIHCHLRKDFAREHYEDRRQIPTTHWKGQQFSSYVLTGKYYWFTLLCKQNQNRQLQAGSLSLAASA